MEGLAFRWPVKGRVISEYGTKPNGLRNEGINISVPEGTGIRAAEGGIVAYAGNELKGYGNLVLIRHEGGWVTAYAHNRELFVKRGDTVRRGDVIAKAGQTGSVTSPQLHFEVRKGATAVDPMRFLNSATAWN
jgi:murein DD-endopeptidase MepM/ murein hydrolase activator NlpD